MFAYTALAPDGARTSGEIGAADKLAALDQIVAKGLTPIEVKEGQAAQPWWNRDIHFFGAPTLKPKELESFFSALSTMLTAQTPLPRALRFCAEIAPDRVMKAKLLTAVAAVEDGMSLTDALATDKPAFPHSLITLIKLGEASNNLATVVTRAAQMLETEAQLRREVQQSLIYPIILLCMSVFVLAVLVFYLAPTLAPVFASANAAPPAIIGALVSLQEVLSNDWLLVLVGAAAIFVLLYAIKPTLAHLFRQLLQLLPVTSHYLTKRETLRFCQTLHLMLSSGGQLADAIKTAAQTAGQPKWQVMLTTAHRDIEAGQSMTTALLGNPLIDPMTRTILTTGEESDQLTAVLGAAVKTLQMQTSQTLSQMVKLLTPVLTLVIGLAVGAVILSTISAIMDLNDVVF